MALAGWLGRRDRVAVSVAVVLSVLLVAGQFLAMYLRFVR